MMYHRSLRTGMRRMPVQVPPEVYDLFSHAGKQGAEAEKKWDATWAEYQSKYPEVSLPGTSTASGHSSLATCILRPAHLQPTSRAYWSWPLPEGA